MAFVACIGGSITIDGAEMAVEAGGFNCSSQEDEVTNLAGGGYYESVSTYKKAEANADCIYDGDNPPTFEEGDVVPIVLTSADGVGISGDFRINSMNFPILNVRNAVKYSLTMSSQGAYTRLYGGGAAMAMRQEAGGKTPRKAATPKGTTTPGGLSHGTI